MFKIQRRSDGLFSSGGCSFTKQGKVWSTLGRLKAHLSMRDRYKSLKDTYSDYDVIEYVANVGSITPVEEFKRKM